MQSITIVPLYDRVVVKRVESATTTDAGLVIPEVARERPQEAIVVAVGCGKAYDEPLMMSGDSYAPMYRKPAVSVGDRVLLNKYAGSEVLIGTREYVVVREDEILGILRHVEETEVSEEL